MLTKSSLVALLTACVTVSIVSAARTEKPLMHSSAFDWNSIEVKPSKTGSSRQFFRAPTATLDEWNVM